MKRFLPFAIIIVVGLLTIGAGAMFYRARMAVAGAVPVATARPVDATLSNAQETEPLHARGPVDAPVTLEEFGDFQCPSCATVSDAINRLEPDYGPRLRVIFREFPLAMHSHAVEAAMAAEAAGLQGRFWEMHDMLYQYQTVWSRVSDVSRFFGAYAESLGLDVERFRTDSQGPAVRARVISEGELGVSRGVKNTPTLFINGSEFRGAFTRERLRAAIDVALAAKKKP
jgi:protein-disulfide isomerase